MWKGRFIGTVNRHNEARSCHAGFVKDHASELVQLIFKTLPYYHSRAAQRAVLQFIKQTVREDAFMKAMAGGLVRQGTQKLPPQHAFTLLCWSCTVVRQFELPSAKKAVQKLAECQVSPHETSKPRHCFSAHLLLFEKIGK